MTSPLDHSVPTNPRESEMELWMMSPETLEVITSYLTCFEIGQLCFCGSKRLFMLFKHGGVRKITFSVPLGCPLRSLPSLFLEFSHLDFFSFEYVHRVSGYNNTRDDFPLSTLPTTLRTLKVKSFSLISQLRIDNLLHRFVELHSLILSDDTPLEMSDVLSLPSTLGELQCSIYDEKQIDLEFLPTPHLTRLDMKLETRQKVNTVSLAHMLVLTDVTSRSSKAKFKFLSFPPSLTRLHLDESMTQEDFAELPPSCTIVHIAAPTKVENETLVLPLHSSSSLRTFSLSTRKSLGWLFRKVTIMHIDPKPQSLTKLDLTTSVEVTRSIIHLLPQGLTWLSCSFSNSHSEEAVTFPTSLTRLEIFKGDLSIFSFPPSLIHLRVPKISLAPKKLEWPKSLQYLETSLFETRPTSIFGLAISRQSAVLQLPSRLEGLTLVLTAHTSIFEVIPTECLTRLSLQTGEMPTPYEFRKTFPVGWISHLPTSLVHLSFKVSPQIFEEDFIRQLNLPNLQTLNFGFYPLGHNISPLDLDLMPPNLTELMIIFSRQIPWTVLKLNETMKHMKRLTILRECEGTTVFPENWLEKLPPKLVYLQADLTSGAKVPAKWIAILGLAHIDFNARMRI
jgi:hypothetical protein